MTIPSSERCLQNVTFFDSELMIARSEVYLKETIGTLKLVEQVINTGDGILILDCDFVQLTVVDAHSERTIFLSHEKNWSTA